MRQPQMFPPEFKKCGCTMYMQVILGTYSYCLSVLNSRTSYITPSKRPHFRRMKILMLSIMQIPLCVTKFPSVICSLPLPHFQG